MNPNLTLEERERLAYITNSPTHALVLAALEGEEGAQEEIEELQGAAEDHEKEVEKLKGEIEDKDTQIADLELKVTNLEERIHEAGVDLVA